MLKVLGRMSSVALPACAATAVFCAAPACAAPAAEVLVTTANFGEIEFDWARDGVDCPVCNFGAGNSRFVWSDTNNRLWVANVDFNTGDFLPPDGHGVLVDVLAAYWSDFNNGPEWAFSAQGSQLVYTRYSPGPKQGRTPANTGVGLAQMVNGAWTQGFVDGSLGRVLPAPSQNIGDAQARMAYGEGVTSDVYWRFVGGTSSEVLMPWGNQNDGQALRWVPGTSQIVFAGLAKPTVTGKVYQQVFLYDTATEVEQQLTFDPTQKRVAFMQPAPEFGGDMIFLTLANQTRLNIYRNTTGPGGGAFWKLVNSIAAPAATPYMNSPEPFVHNGRTYVFMLVSSQPSADANNNTTPTHIALTGIDPAVPSFRMLTDDSQPARLRHDPEYFITANGAYIYYSRGIPKTAPQPVVNEGRYRVDTGLGPPSH